MARKRNNTPEVRAIETSLRDIDLGPSEYTLLSHKKGSYTARIRLTAKTSEALRAFENGTAQAKLEACKPVQDVKKKADNIIDLYFTRKKPVPEKETRATRVKSATAKKPKDTPVRKKLVRHKVSHRKVANKGRKVKLLGKMAMPRNTKDKPHVEFFFNLLNSNLITPKQRAEVVEEVAKFATDTSSCKKYDALMAKLEGKLVIDPKSLKAKSIKL